MVVKRKKPKKITSKITRKISKKTALRKKKLTRTLPLKKVKAAQGLKPDFLHSQQTQVETTKFATFPEAIKVSPKVSLEELPVSYGQDKIVIQVRDPWWIHAYWEVSANTWDNLKDKLKEAFLSAKKVLRVYDVSFINFNGTNAHRYFNLEVSHEANNWYIDTALPGRSWCVDFGLRLSNGQFITIVRSNTVTTPIDGPSWITDEEWMIPEDLFARLYGMGFGLGRSSPIGKAWQERVKKALFSGAFVSSPSPVKKLAKERKFHLAVNTELILYGATEPDAKVTVQGNGIKLRPDGTFTLRFALPDGRQVIPVKAVSSDNQEERSITPIVNKETKYSG